MVSNSMLYRNVFNVIWNDNTFSIRIYYVNTRINIVKELNMKQIHFYKDGLIESCYGWYLTHNSTISAIESNNPCIYTTAISALDFSYLLDKGYRIFLHENGKVGEIREGVTELTDRVIRKVHDIKRIWIGGGFHEYFYNK